jgi:hypothetical protein
MNPDRLATDWYAKQASRDEPGTPCSICGHVDGSTETEYRGRTYLVHNGMAYDAQGNVLVDLAVSSDGHIFDTDDGS